VFYRVRGKVGYMSPEQARNQAIDHRTDLYSVAVCLYEALTLERLFVGDLSTPADAIYSQPVVAPSKKRNTLPAALDVVLATALAMDPNDRYQDAVAFAEALRQVAHRHGLLYSAPQLAEHLRFILGRDPSSWLTDERPAASGGDPSTQKIPAKELEGKEASSIGVVINGSNLYVADSPDVVSPGTVNGGSVKSDLRRKLGLPPDEDDFDIEETTRRGDPEKDDDTTSRLPDPEAAAAEAFVSVEDEDDVPTRIRDRGIAEPTPPPTPPPTFKRRPTPPPPPAHALAPQLPAESPFDDMPPTPAPLFDGVEIAPPTPGPIDIYAAGPPPPLPPLGFAPQALPPPGRPAGGLPRPGGYLDPQHGTNLRSPPAPRLPAAPPLGDFGSNGSFGAPTPFGTGGFEVPQTIDFGASAPVAVRRSGPPGLLMLIFAIAGAVGGAKLGEVVTRNDLAALDGSARGAEKAPASEAAAPQRK
jgi:hypothetical protein